jgi:serine/threonine protein kinase
VPVPALAFPFVDGFTLQEILEARQRVGRRLTPTFALGVLTRLAQVLAGLHRCRYVHRDVKPANLLLHGQPGNGGDLFLIDFGIAGPQGQLALEEWELGTVTRQIVERVLARGHSRLYASPQQLHGDLSNPNDDVYSAGVVAIQCLSGDLGRRVDEYDWEPLLEARSTPGWLVDLLRDCVAVQANRRPLDGDELLTRLQAA